MKVLTPGFYKDFHCIAGNCPDTCCQEWDIQVDEETAEYYASLPGELGEKIRSSLLQKDGDRVIGLKNGRCPMQDAQGLCSLQSAFGEKALSKVCREFPRLSHDYGNYMELGLELSCPEAARLLLTAPWGESQLLEIPGGTEPDYDTDAMALLLSTRKNAFAILNNEAYSPSEALSLLFFWGLHVQQLLDGEDPSPFDPAAALETALQMGKQSADSDFINFFLDLEILTDEWQGLLKTFQKAKITPICRRLAAYLLGRYWLQAVSDYDLYCRVKFILLSCILTAGLPGDFVWNAHLFSKEIENDIDNVDAILDAAYSAPVFTDDRLLGFLL